VSIIQLDSNSDLTPGSAQINWLRQQLAGLPPTVDFVLLGLHHPPVADVQQHLKIDHNPRANEIALREFLSGMAPSFHAAILVVAGHIHNYERAEVGGVTYLVSGGGGAHPYYVERTKDDLYQDINFPIFHYVRIDVGEKALDCTMFKVKDPDDATPVWEAKDHFVIGKK
jgi:hypothetical protein